MAFEKAYPLKTLSNGIVIPTKDFLIDLNRQIIKFRKSLGRTDPHGLRSEAPLIHLCDVLEFRAHKYKSSPLDNALYVSTETFFYIGCQHPFIEGNKSTAYLAALVLLHVNIETYVNRLSTNKFTAVPIPINVNAVVAPKRAWEITKLVECNKEENEIKTLIKQFLQEYIVR